MTRDEMIEKWRIAMYPHIDAPTFASCLADMTATAWNEVRQEINALVKLAALRAPAVTGEAVEAEHRAQALKAAFAAGQASVRVVLRDTVQACAEALDHHPDWCGYRAGSPGHTSFQEARGQIDAARAILAAPPAAGAPPALVALQVGSKLADIATLLGAGRVEAAQARIHALYAMCCESEPRLLDWSLVPAPVSKEETCVVCDGPVVDASGHQACVAGRYDAVVCGPCRSELAAAAPHPAGGVRTDFRGSDGAMLAPADEARKVISACTARGARLPDMHQLQSAITDIIVERNRQAGVGLRFRDINTGVVTDEFGREHHPSFEAKTHQDSLQNVAASTLDTPAHTSVPACPEGQHSYRRNAPPQPGDVCFVCRKSIYMPAAPFVVSPGDVVVSKLGNRWTVTAVDGRLLLLHNAPPEVPGARGTTVSGPMPEWAAVVERNGAVIWSAQPQTPGCDCDQPGNPDVACHASDCLWRVALAPAVERGQ